MANRFPLIVDSSALQIKEIPNGDGLDLTGNSIVNAVNITATGDITASGNISVGGTLTYSDVTNIDSVGLVTARQGIRIGGGSTVGPISGVVTYFGSAEGLTSIPAGQLTGALPAISGANLTGLPAAGIGIRSDGTTIGFGVTFLNFTGSGIGTITTHAATGIGTVVVTGGGGGGGGGGISTDAQVKTSGQTALLDLDNAQDHKITCSGTVTISSTGGNEGESHTIRIINSGTATVGFSTYFLFPSGSTPSLPTGSGSISLVSFTIHRVGAAGTQLLAGASLNLS
jgi:hypothetical protein